MDGRKVEFDLHNHLLEEEDFIQKHLDDTETTFHIRVTRDSLRVLQDKKIQGAKVRAKIN